MKFQCMVFLIFISSSAAFCADSLTVSLSVGNTYSYIGTRHFHGQQDPYSDSVAFLESVTADTLIGGKRYLIVTRSSWFNKQLWPFEDSASTFYRRTDSTSIYQYDPVAMREDTLINFRDTLHTHYYSSGYFIASEQIKPIFSGSYPTFFMYSIDGAHRQLSRTYSPKFYVTEYLTQGIIEMTVELHGAIINGIKFGTITAISAGSHEAVEDFALMQNYPNPFNPSTAISFSLASRSFVSLKIFDPTGREVASIVSEELPAGNYQRQWNASGYPSGVYFYRLEAGAYSETKRLILLK